MPTPFLLTAATVAPASVAPASVSVVTASGSTITSVSTASTASVVSTGSTASTLPAVSSDTASSAHPGTSSASSLSLQTPHRPAIPAGLPPAPPATPATPSVTTASASVSASVSASTAASTRLPSSSTQRDIAEARQAVDASMANLLDTQLRDRAALMHDNMRAIHSQQRDLGRAVTGLRKANDGLARLVHEFTGSYKEMGHVQNWAEMQYQNISVLEETMRLVRERRARQELRQEQRLQGRDNDDSWSSSSYSYSGSYSGSSRSASPARSAAGGDAVGEAVTVDEHVDLSKGVAAAIHDSQGEAAARDPKGKGKAVDTDARHESALAQTDPDNHSVG